MFISPGILSGTWGERFVSGSYIFETDIQMLATLLLKPQSEMQSLESILLLFASLRDIVYRYRNHLQFRVCIYHRRLEICQRCCCKIWGFHGGDYEECRLLGYKNAVHTSQETHYVSATEPSRLMLCKIWGVHGCDYEECRLLGCYAVWLLSKPMFRRKVSPPSSGWQELAN
jgi:hypothetical protein